VSSNLNRLVEDIVGESRAKAEELRKKALSEIEEILAREKAESVREAEHIVRAAKAEAEAEKNRRISQAKQQARLVYLAEKNKVVQGVLKDLQSMLSQFTRDDSSYRPFLLGAIARGVRSIPSETVRITVSERDLKTLKGTKLLEDALATAQTAKKAVLSDEPIRGIGGAVITSEDGKIKADCTIETRLQMMEPQLLAEISRILFAS